MQVIMKINVFVKAGSSKGPLIIESDSVYIIYLKERRIEGSANKALIALLSKHFSVSKNRVTILKGFTSTHKTIGIDLD